MQFILNADDFGRTETANEAITYGFQNRYLYRTTIMVNMPYYEEAKALAKQYGFYDKIGLHINLVSGEPLTEDIKVCKNFIGENGRFNGQIFCDKKLWFFLSKIEKKALYTEIEAQINKYLSDGFTLMHADSHGHTHTFPSINKIVIPLLKKYNFKSVRITKNLCVRMLLRPYKLIIDVRSRRFNATNNVEMKHFGSCKDVMSSYRKIKGPCEVMLHPNFYDGVMLVEENIRYSDIYEFIIKNGGEVL